MDLKSLLNNPDDRDHRPRNPSDASSVPNQPAPPKRQPPPPLSTPRSSSHPHVFSQSATPVLERQQSATSYSPGPPYSASSHTPTPISSGPTNFPSPYPRHAPLPSPSSRPVSTPTSYFAPGQRPASNHSGVGRASSSPYEQAAAYNPTQSPSASRNNSYHPGVTSPLQAQPQTPLAPPPLPRGDSSLGFKDISVSHNSHQYSSPSASHRPSLHASRSLSYSASDMPSPAPPAHLNGSPNNRRSSAHSMHSRRQSSLSVSPKTIVMDLPSTRHTHHLQPTPLGPDTQPSRDPIPAAALRKELQPAPEIRHTSPVDSDSAKVKNETDRIERIERPAKRDAEEELPAAPAKRPRKIKQPPIWARPKRGLKPLKGSGLGPANGEIQAAAAAPAAVAASREPVAGTSVAEQGYEPSITNIIPYEETTRRVAMFVFGHIANAPEEAPFEIEAKLGVLCEAGTHERIRLPVQSEAILDDSVDCTFESQMSVENHQAMNKYLNELLVKSKMPQQDPSKCARVPIDYRHSREVDQFYDLPADEQQLLSQQLQQNLREQAHRFKPKVRVTKDQQTNLITAKIVKSRVADMHVYCPNQQFDWRISINLEQEWAGNVGTLQMSAAPDRNKDRLSYSHQWCQIDLTQVRSSEPHKRPTHELEVEMDMKQLREQARLARDGDPRAKFEDMIKVFMDNVRTLARY